METNPENIENVENIDKTDSDNSNGSGTFDINLQHVFEDNPFVVHNTFYIREYHDSDFISVLDFAPNFVCIGTMTG
jgi:hypothetical protein